MGPCQGRYCGQIVLDILKNNFGINIIIDENYEIIKNYDNFFKKLRCEFSKGGFLWGLLGENLDFTDTDKGLFIGSKTTRPHILHHSKDDKGRILDYLTTSECEPLISATSLANIDYMDIVKGHNATDDRDYIVSGVYGEKEIWILQRDHDSSLGGGTDYTTFFQSELLGFAAAKGVGGIIVQIQGLFICGNRKALIYGNAIYQAKY